MPRSTATAAEETRRRLLGAAARGFRISGYGGLGVDTVAKDAGVTSGAFYAHFGSKADAFRETLRAGLGELRNGIATWREQGPGWLRRFAMWYLGPQRRADLSLSCALPTLSLEAARADDATRAQYAALLQEIAATLAGDESLAAQEPALAVLALLSGGMIMAHAVGDSRLGARIARAVANAVEKVGMPEQSGVDAGILD
jgi:AcrR family transcriptional regulator